MMIRRRFFACYLFFGLGMILLIYSLNSVYTDRYEGPPSEGHVLQQALQAPDPFPKGRPDVRRKHEEEMRAAEEAKRQEEERRRKEEEDRQRKQDAEQQSKAEKQRLRDEELRLANEKASTEAAKDSAAKVKALVAAINAGATPEQLALPVKARVTGRKKRYMNWMRNFNELSENDQKQISLVLQAKFFDMEHKETKSFEAPVVYPEEEKVNGRIQPSGKKIVLLTASDGNEESEIENVVSMALANRAEYTSYHGYSNYFVNLTKYAEPGRHPSWNKIHAIREAFDANPDAEWVWWLDTDVIIMNPEIDIAEHVLSKRALSERLSYGRPLRNVDAKFYNGIYMRQDEVNLDSIALVATQDFFGLSTGSFFMRRSSFTEYLLDQWNDPVYVNSDFVRREQDALIHMFLNHESMQQHVGLVPQRLINSYSNVPNGVWTYNEGDFVINFDGCVSVDKCQEFWITHWQTRGRVPDAFRLHDAAETNAAVSRLLNPDTLETQLLGQPSLENQPVLGTEGPILAGAASSPAVIAGSGISSAVAAAAIPSSSAVGAAGAAGVLGDEITGKAAGVLGDKITGKAAGAVGEALPLGEAKVPVASKALEISGASITKGSAIEGKAASAAAAAAAAAAA